jgi:hypothetical protein
MQPREARIKLGQGSRAAKRVTASQRGFLSYVVPVNSATLN